MASGDECALSTCSATGHVCLATLSVSTGSSSTLEKDVRCPPVAAMANMAKLVIGTSSSTGDGDFNFGDGRRRAPSSVSMDTAEAKESCVLNGGTGLAARD